MRNNLSKFAKAFTSMACFSSILISNNSELAARYLLDKEGNLNKIVYSFINFTISFNKAP